MPKSVKNALRNSAFQGFGAFGITGLNFVLMLGYARLLGPGRLGELTTAQAHVLVWVFVVDLGLSSALIGALTAAEGGRDLLARQGFRARDIVFRVLVLRLGGAALAAAVVIAIAFFRCRVGGDLDEPAFRREIAFLPQLFAIACQLTAVSYAAFRGRQGLGQAALLVSTATTVALPLWLASRGASIATLLVSQCWGGFLAALIIALSFWIDPVKRDSRRAERGYLKRGPWGIEAWRALARDARPYALTFAAVVLWQRLDQIAASELLGFEQGGQYALGVRLAAIPILMAVAVGHALFPDLQRVGRDAPEKVSVYMGVAVKFTFRYGALLTGILVIAVCYLAVPLVPQFKPGIRLLPWFFLGIWAYWLHSFLTSGLFGLRCYREVVRCYALALLAYAAALVPLTKAFGLPGIAASSSLFSIVLFFAAMRAAKARGALAKDFSPAAPYTRAEAELAGAVREKIFGFGARIFSRAGGRG